MSPRGRQPPSSSSSSSCCCYCNTMRATQCTSNFATCCNAVAPLSLPVNELCVRVCVCVCVQQCLHLVAALAPLAFQRLYANCSAVSCCHLFLCLCLRRCSHSNQSKVLVVLGLPAVTTRSCSPLPDVARPSLPALPVVRNNFHINVNSNNSSR